MTSDNIIALTCTSHKLMMRQGKRILVIGDVMLDRFVEGEIKRKSPEANAPIVFWKAENNVLGGAANVAANVKSLGGVPELLSVVGNDNTGKQIKKLLKKSGIKYTFLTAKDRPTTLKVRIFGNNKYLLRFDREEDRVIDKSLTNKLINLISRRIASSDAVVFSDYKKGVLSQALVRKIISFARANKIPIIADFKPGNAGWYKGVTTIKPNAGEAKAIAGTADLKLAAKKISKMLDANVVLTQGEKGMIVFERATYKLSEINGIKVAMKDIVGAGDVVISRLALGVASGESLYDSAKIANSAAALSVGKHGTVAVTASELKNFSGDNV